MCGRFTQTTDGEALAEVFDLVEAPEVEARYNIAPTSPVLIVRASDEGRRTIDAVRWGLLPGHMPDRRRKGPTINARSETAHRLWSFRKAFRARRCLVAADGWIEWTPTAQGKQPWRFVREDGRPFGFAGLWEAWTSDDGEVIESCTILTVEPNPLAARIHDRMPLVLAPEHFEAWLSPLVTESEAVIPLLVTPTETGFEVYPCDPRINSVRNRGVGCVARAPVQTSLL